MDELQDTVAEVTELTEATALDADSWTDEAQAPAWTGSAASSEDETARALAQIAVLLALACIAGSVALPPETTQASRVALFGLGLALLAPGALALYASLRSSGLALRVSAIWIGVGAAQGLIIAGALALIGPSATIVGSALVAAAGVGVVAGVAVSILPGAPESGRQGILRVTFLAASALPLLGGTLLNALAGGQGLSIPNLVVLACSALGLGLLAVHARALAEAGIASGSTDGVDWSGWEAAEPTWDESALDADVAAEAAAAPPAAAVAAVAATALPEPFAEVEEAPARASLRSRLPGLPSPVSFRPGRRHLAIAGGIVAGLALAYLGRLEAGIVVAAITVYGARFEAKLFDALGHRTTPAVTLAAAPGDAADEGDDERAAA